MSTEEEKELKMMVVAKIDNEFHEFMSESPRDCVGQAIDFCIEFNGNNYDVTGDMFWEKSEWYTYNIKGDGVNVSGDGGYF